MKHHSLRVKSVRSHYMIQIMQVNKVALVTTCVVGGSLTLALGTISALLEAKHYQNTVSSKRDKKLRIVVGATAVTLLVIALVGIYFASQKTLHDLPNGTWATNARAIFFKPAGGAYTVQTIWPGKLALIPGLLGCGAIGLGVFASILETKERNKNHLQAPQHSD